MRFPTLGPSKSRAAQLIEVLEAIGSRRDLPWTFLARSYVRRLHRNSTPDRIRPREDIIFRLEGAEEIIRACNLLDDEVADRLGELIIEAWTLHWSGKWPKSQGEVSA